MTEQWIDEVMWLVARLEGAVEFGAREQIQWEKEAIRAKLRELVPGWLPIESAPQDEYVMVWNRDYECVSIAEQSEGNWFDEHGMMDEDPTHWMPLPKEPV